MSEINKQICLLYLTCYEKKDVMGIAALFSNEIVLRDWEIRVEGKANALREIQKSFQTVTSIQIKVLSIYENEHTVAAELKITIDGKDELFVVEVITISSEGKINSIKAFIGRGDH